MPKELIIFNNLLYFIGGISGLLFLYFRMKDSYQKDTDRETTKNWYREVWGIIDKQKFFKLPFQTIEWVINSKTKLIKKLINFSNKYLINLILPEAPNSKPLLYFGVYHAFSVFIFYCENGFNWKLAIFCIFPIIVFFLIFFSLVNSQYAKVINVGNLIIIIIFVSSGIFYILKFFIKQNQVVSTLVFVLLIPVLAIVLDMLAFAIFYFLKEFNVSTSDNKLEVVLSFGIATSISFSVTMFALLIGCSIHPEFIFPKSAQLLLYNGFFDGLTLVVTFRILNWSIKKRPSIRIPIGILVDLLIAGLFACCSIYLALFATDNYITFGETINILFAKSIDGGNWELGPYFWVMHTTFIPTLLYLMFICLTIIGKYITLPIMRFFKGVSGAEKPFYATATTFGFIGGVMIGIAQLIAWCNR